MGCETTKGLAPYREIIGQERAIRALKFGMGIKERGFNVYVAGYPGTGRTTAVKSFLEELAPTKPVPSDWCYVNNFSDEYQPKAIRLQPGKGKEFQRDVKNFIDNARTALPKTFQTEDYAKRREATISKLENRRKELAAQIEAEANKGGFVIQSTPIGLMLVPVIKDKPISAEELMALPPKTREVIEKKKEALEADLRSAFRQLVEMDEKIHDELEKLNREVAIFAIGHLLSDITEKYKDNKDIKEYLEAVKNDIFDHLQQFIMGPEERPQLPFPMPWLRETPFRKYEVNVVVDNSEVKGAPVVIEVNPTHRNLFGKTEKEAQFGALITDFKMIRAGSLHRANGGYLVLPVEELLRKPFSYEVLKRALKKEQIDVEEVDDYLGFFTAKSLRPQPIPLSVKVVLIGDSYLHQMLYTLDKEFSELFKVKAQFDTTMERTEEHMQQYAGFVCGLCERDSLCHLDGSGLAKLIEHSSRLAGDQLKLSSRLAEIADIVHEANFYATEGKSKFVTGEHIKKAIEEKIYRSKLIQEKLQEMIKRGVLLIDTEDEAIGQVNGLSVIGMGDFSFGMPSRVTSSIGLGREGVIDIEREAKMGGPIHTKGVLILSGYLNQKYAQDKPLSLSAGLVFEQNYEGVEGDSASSTELYSILSNLAGLPVKQNLAVTGSVNQRGEVQAIGGVNEKIEGFFEVCKLKGLTGKQGVMIPASNVENLMLKEEIVEAVKKKKFHVYPVKTIDEGIEVLTGTPAGKRLDDGTFEPKTVNYKVDKRLKEMAEKLRDYPPSEKKKKGD